MITGIDHIAITVEDVAEAGSDYAMMLGRQTQELAGGARRLQLDNAGIVLDAAPKAAERREGAVGLRLVLEVPDLGAAMHRLERRGLTGTLDQDASVYALDTATTHGVAIGVAKARDNSGKDAGADIAGLDHVVVRTGDPERAVALYGGRLGLDLRLDRTNPEHGNRLLFFVCGGLVVEISHDTRRGVRAGPDRIFGLAWRANDIERAHVRMSAEGIDVSEIRTGRRPGTRVFTVRNRTAGVPTLVIGGDGLERK
ncbi:MAG: VOC family protein [Hyphomicrobiaceae bacterium]